MTRTVYEFRIEEAAIGGASVRKEYEDRYEALAVLERVKDAYLQNMPERYAITESVWMSARVAEYSIRERETGKMVASLCVAMFAKRGN